MDHCRGLVGMASLGSTVGTAGMATEGMLIGSGINRLSQIIIGVNEGGMGCSCLPVRFGWIIGVGEFRIFIWLGDW